MSSDVPLAQMGSDLVALLLRSLLWLSVAAVVIGAATSLLARRRPDAVRRVRAALLGPRDAETELPARRFLRISLGLLWVVDGLLQAQPEMPAGFVRDMLSPRIASSPSWLGGLLTPLAEVWTKHPVAADAATVWIQVGLGVLILVGGRGLLSTAVLWASVAWGAVVWVAGEFLGGLLSTGASWLVGAPGAVLLYGIAALLLLAPTSWWESGRSTMLARRGAAAWILAGAALQALPWEGSWSADGMSQPFADGSSTAQPSVLRQPIVWMTTLSDSHPIAVNAVLVALLVAIGLGLWFSHRRTFVVAALVLCAATWWLGQDFGVLGGVGTDPNAALPLALILACTLRPWTATTAVGSRTRDSAVVRTPWRLREPAVAGVTAVGVGAALVAPLMVLGVLVGPAGAAAVTADSGGGMHTIPHRPAPTFALTDQTNRPVSSADLHGKLTLLTFLDPVCSDDCPVIANQLAVADRELGAQAGRIQIIAIDTNPLFHRVSDVAAFTTSHGLDDLPNWHFLAGPTTTLQNLTAAYGIGVGVPAVGMIQHGEGIYFLAPDGTEEAYLDDGANDTLTATYAQAVRDEVRRLLA